MADIPVDMEAFCDFMTRGDGLLDSLKKKAPYLKNLRVIATHYNGKGNFARLNEFGKSDGWNLELDTQPPQSPDINKCDICFF